VFGGLDRSPHLHCGDGFSAEIAHMRFFQRHSVFASSVFAMTNLCGCTEVDLSTPPDLRAGLDECVECGMLISDQRCAAACLIERGHVQEFVLFDDIGCIAVFEKRLEPNTRLVRTFVRDYAGNAWLDGDGAIYLKAPIDRLRTPMASGTVAFEEYQAALNAKMEYGGEILSLAELRQGSRGR
jgi:nitrous oxide reductase accessory protein NosL